MVIDFILGYLKTKEKFPLLNGLFLRRVHNNFENATIRAVEAFVISVLHGEAPVEELNLLIKQA